MNDTRLFDRTDLNSRSSAPLALVIRLLGPFELFIDDAPVPSERWPRRRPKLLLKLLALQPRRELHREQIMDMLWPDADFEAAANNLHKAIYIARRALEPELKSRSKSRFITVRDNLVALQAPGDVWVDACAFERSAGEAMRSNDPSLFEAALDLYRGDLLPEDLYEDWAAAPRERLRRLYIDLLYRLAKIREESGDYVAGIGLLQSLLAADPTNEEVHRSLMRLYILAGDRRGALAQYRHCVEALRREVDVGPDRTTIELYDRISGQASKASAPQEEISREIAEKLYLGMTGDEKRELHRHGTHNEEAFELYLKGRYCWNFRSGERMLQAVGYYEQSLAKDPGYALAWSGMADAYNHLAMFGMMPAKIACGKAMDAASRALELDGNLAEAHASLGYTQLTYLWDHAAGSESYLRAIKLKPWAPLFHQWYGVALISVFNEVEPALSELKRSLQIDPVSIVNRASLGWGLYFARRYDEAIEVLKQTIELDSNIQVPHLFLGRTFWRKGLFAEAVDSFQQAVVASNGDTPIRAELIAARAMAGDRHEATRLLDDLQAAPSGKYVSPYFLALIHLALGDDEMTLAMLEAAFWERATQLMWLNVEPRFDRLRNHSRFRDLLKRLGY